MSDDILKIKKITDITDQVKRKKVLRELLDYIKVSIARYNDYFQPRRERLLEINAIYRNQSYYDKNKSGWQTKINLPTAYNAVEKRTSILQQALWGNRLSSLYSCVGRTPEDQDYAESAEGVLNNTVDRIGLYSTSEQCLRSTTKNGLGVYRYGWERKNEERLWREQVTKDGKAVLDKDGQPTYKFVRKTIKVNQPFIKSLDIVDSFGFDPLAIHIDKWGCGYAYEIEQQTKEQIYENEVKGIYEKGSFDRLKEEDPHGISEFGMLSDKVPQIRKDDGLNALPYKPLCEKYKVVHWEGWFDIDGDGLREFIRVSCILENQLILCAEENLIGEYMFIDVPYSKSLHSMLSWGVLDPVVELYYQVNEFFNQRGDSIKLKLHPQFLINTNRILEDHAYVSSPGAFHPFAMEEGENLNNALRVVEFQNNEYLSVTEEERLLNVWRETTGNIDISQAISSINRTPATTLISLLNQNQAADSLIVNNILDRHAVLGSRILYLIQLFGDQEFILRTAGRRGLKFRKETLANILGEYDVKVTTSTFMGNKEMELQQLIQLRPQWVNAAHIDMVEVDKSIIENILPKKVEKILRVEDEPLDVKQEIALFASGQGESVRLSKNEDIASLTNKLKFYDEFRKGGLFKLMEGQDLSEFNTHIDRIALRIQELQQQQQIMAQEAAKAQMAGQPQGQGGQPNGNLTNTGSPAVRQLGNMARPATNNIPQQ